MRLFLLKLIGFFLFGFATNVSAQYTITGNVNASSYSCASFLGYTTIYIGDGTTSTNLSMNSTLDLYNSCSLGAIQFVVRNQAVVDFSPGNDRLVLPLGSSIIIEPGGNLIGGNGSNCSASERIYIGTDLIASCNGGAGADYTFAQLVSSGGYSPINATADPGSFCASGTSSITATANPSSGATYKWYTVVSGGTPVYTGNPYSTGSISTTATYYVEASYASPTYTTVRKAVTVTVNTASSIALTSGAQNPTVCPGTAIINTVYTFGGSATNASVSGLPAGLTSSVNVGAKTVTISGTPTASGTYTITTSGHTVPCTAATISGTISFNTLSTVPTGITGINTICNGNSTTLTVNGGNVGTGAIVEWFTGSCGGTSAGTGNSITVSPTSNTTYYVRYKGTCNTTSCVSQLVTVNTLSVAPTGITGTSTICNGDSTTLAVSGGSFGTAAVVEWFTGSCGGTLVGTGNSITVSPTSNTTYYVRYKGTCNTTTCTSQLVTVNPLPNNITNGFSATTICTGGSPQLTFDAENATFSTPYSITYKNDDTSIQYTVSIPTASPYSFTPADNPTSNTGYTLVSISNATCTRTTGFTNAGANLMVRPIPIATISGTTSVCVGDSAPNVTFVNPQSYAVTITYNINGGTNQMIDVASNSSATVPVATTIAGTYTYNLVSVVYRTPSICSTAISGSATVTVNPNLPASVAIGASPSGAICAGTSVSFTAIPTNGGTAPVYQWKVNGNNVATGTTYTTTTLANNDVVTVMMTSNASPCLTGSPATSSGITMIVNPIPVTPLVGTITQPTCATANGSFGITNYNATYTYIVSPSTGVNVSGSSVTAPVGTYSIHAELSGCSSSSTSFTINPQPITPNAPTIGTITQPTCTEDTGSVVLNGLPSSGTWTLVRSGTSSATTTGTGTSTTITGLTDGGSYFFTVSNGICTSSLSSSVDINSISTTMSTWNGSAWINGFPDSSKRIVFAGNFSSTSDIVGCSCKVTSGANVFVNSPHTLTITNSVDVISGALTFENNASLVQINDTAINTGNINYKRYTTPVRRYDFTYWSSPVAGQTLKSLSPNTLYDKYYGYNPATGWVIYYNGAKIMDPGNGYLIRAPQSFSITTATIDTNPVFVGVPNNGVFNLSLLGSKSYLLGNPYPSAINADTFLDANATVLEGTLYFWTHNSPPSNAVGGDATYNYTSNDYATYNRTGGVGTAAATGGAVPNGKIAAGQGFFAPTTTSGGTLVFNNSMRITANNSQFFRLSTASKSSGTAAAEKNRIWLNLTNSEGAFKQTLIGYLSGATNGFDRGFDGITYDGNSFVDFYSVNQGVNLSIQGRTLPFETKDSVALGYRSAIKGEFQISIDHLDGILASQNLFLEDKDLKKLHNLKDGTYSFTTEKGVFNNRFVLRYVDRNAVVKDLILDNSVLVSVSNNEVKISSSKGPIDKVIIYDVLGRTVYQKEEVEANEFIIQNLNLAHQIVILNIVLINGQIVSAKIVY